MAININTKKIPLFVLATVAISVLIFWYLQTQAQVVMLITLLFSAIYLGKRNIDRLGLFLPVLIGWFIVYFIKK